MATRLIIVNGGSSSGKSSIVRAFQAQRSEPWLALSVDDFVDALPPSLRDSDVGLEVAADGTVAVGEQFHRLEAAWRAGIAAMARAGARIVLDEVFLGGGVSQERCRSAFAGLEVLWAGVRCSPAVAESRESTRGDRVPGMAASQAETVHRGVVYDFEVDSSHADPESCARAMAAWLDGLAG